VRYEIKSLTFYRDKKNTETEYRVFELRSQISNLKSQISKDG